MDQNDSMGVSNFYVQALRVGGITILISNAVVDCVENVDAASQQGMGDIDYCLWAIKNGCQIQITSG